MKKHWVGLMALLIFLVMLSGGCMKDKESEAPINVAVTDDIVSLDVAGTKDIISETVGRCVFITLYTFDENLKLVPCLAKEAQRLSDLEWRFTIQSGAKFHDGTALTASDVAFSVRRAMTIDLAEQSLLIIDSIEALDDTTVRVITREPVANLPALFVRTSTSVMSEKAMSDPGYDVEKPVGSGPFKVQERRKGQDIRLERFEGYLGGPARTKYLNFVVEPSESNATAFLLNGKYDVIYRVSANDCDYLKLSDEAKVYQVDSTKTELLILNPREEPMDDIRVRQAIACAIDKQNIVDNVLSGYARSHNSMIPAPLPGFSNYDGYGYDLQRAKTLLREAGYPEGFTMTVLTFDSQRKKLMEYLKLDLAKVNISLNYELMELAEYLETIKTGTQAASVMSWTSNADPDSMLTQLYSAAGHPTVNQNAFSDPRVDKLLQEGRMENDAKRQDEVYREVNKIIAESYFSIPLYQPAILVAARKEIGGIHVNPQGIFGYENLYRLERK